MNNKGFTLVELLASIIVLGILFLIVVMAANRTITPEQEMDQCMSEYEDFDYCKYKLGVDYY